MTIAVGIVTRSYVIVAADSQEASGDMTSSASKVSITLVSDDRSVPYGLLSVSGAGGSDYLRYLKYKLKQDFAAGCHPPLAGMPTDDDATGDALAKFEDAIELRMLDFYQKHYIPFLGESGIESESPDLIIGAHLAGRNALWVTYRSSTTKIRSPGYAAVGSGTHWADAAMAGLTSYVTGEREATLAAAYAIFTAKEHSESCGKETFMVLLRSGGRLHVKASPDDIQQAEVIFRRYNLLQTDMLNAVLTPQSQEIKTRADERIAQIREDLDRIQFYR